MLWLLLKVWTLLQINILELLSPIVQKIDGYMMWQTVQILPSWRMWLLQLKMRELQFIHLMLHAFLWMRNFINRVLRTGLKGILQKDMFRSGKIALMPIIIFNLTLNQLQIIGIVGKIYFSLLTNNLLIFNYLTLHLTQNWVLLETA